MSPCLKPAHRTILIIGLIASVVPAGSIESAGRPAQARLLPQLPSNSWSPSGWCDAATAGDELVIECSHSMQGATFATLCEMRENGACSALHTLLSAASPFVWRLGLDADISRALHEGRVRLVIESSAGSWAPISTAVLADLVFSDGFESRTVCSWSAGVPDGCDAIFVAKWGDDLDSGSMTEPKLSIQEAIVAAAAAPRRFVHVSHGGYFETLELLADVAVVGGFSSDFQARDLELYQTFVFSNERTPTLPGAVNAVGITDGDPGSTALEGFVVFAEDGAPGEVGSSYGVYLRDVDSSLRVADNEVFAGSGWHGRRGIDGIDGADGGPGGNGTDALDLNEAFGVVDHGCLPEHHSAGGAGASGSCADLDASGGNGGERRCPEWIEAAGETKAPEISESGATSAGGAAGGAAGRDVLQGPYSCSGYNVYGQPEAVPGAPGALGPDGFSGASASMPGSVVAGLWLPALAGSGGEGGSGTGGGGGGSGAGAWVEDQCVSWGSDNLGGSGGGGGSGGCRGTGGQGGESGHGSFAVFFSLTSALPNAPEIVGNILHTGNGGRGGDGGRGGNGGSGGNGGPGGAAGGSFEDNALSYPAYAGGDGGDGGKGGNGGGGAGGDGGPSIGIFADGFGGLDLSGWLSANTIVLDGSGGAPGLGGYSLGSPGADGTVGHTASSNY